MGAARHQCQRDRTGLLPDQDDGATRPRRDRADGPDETRRRSRRSEGRDRVVRLRRLRLHYRPDACGRRWRHRRLMENLLLFGVIEMNDMPWIKWPDRPAVE